MATWTVISPALGDTISDSLANIRGNFVVLAAAWDGDHQTLTGDGTSSTKHVQVTMPEFAISPAAGPTTAAGEGAVFTRDIGGRPSLFYRQENDGTEIQLTGVDPVAATAGQTTLPGGMLMKWGTVSVVSGTGAVTFPVAFTTLYNVQTQMIRSGGSGSHSITSQSASGFTLKSSLSVETNTFYWTAIGK